MKYKIGFFTFLILAVFNIVCGELPEYYFKNHNVVPDVIERWPDSMASVSKKLSLYVVYLNASNLLPVLLIFLYFLVYVPTVTSNSIWRKHRARIVVGLA